MADSSQLLTRIKQCQLCADSLPFEPKPILQFADTAKILIIGQAPGKKTHFAGKPFQDKSGERLRAWLGIRQSQFYDSGQIAILPMGFCFPGSNSNGDNPPIPLCAQTWHEQVIASMPNISLTLLIGRYAQQRYLADTKASLTSHVLHWQRYWPEQLPLPHPSPRNNRWFKQNPWFEADVIP